MLKKINNNKILIISHYADIDGMGSVILGKYYFKKIDYLLADNNHDFDLQSDIDYRNYDTIYICDLGFNDKNLEYCLNHPDLANKIKNFDHHESEVWKNKYSFVNEVITLNDHLTSATELFYHYLLSLPNSDFLTTPFFQKLVEAIRCQDTWNFEGESDLGPELASLHAFLGAESFIDLLNSLDCTGDFYLPKEYLAIVNQQNHEMETSIQNYLEKARLVDYQNYKIALSISENYRSQVGHALLKKYPIADFALIINFYRLTCSLRTDNDNFDVGLIAQEFNPTGGGHKMAAGFKIDELSISKINELITKYLEALKTND